MAKRYHWHAVNYAHGYPHWSVTLALAEDGKVTLGVTYDALREQTFFPYSRATSPDSNLPEFNFLMPRVHGVRRAGSVALDLAHVAAGWLDGYWEAHLSPWDWAAGLLMVEEAGGVVTSLDGAPFSRVEERIVASNGRLHPELLAALADARRQV